MSRPIRPLIALLGSLLAAAAHANPPPSPRSVTLAEVVSATAAAPAAAIGTQERAAADAQIDAAAAWPAPSVRLETNRLTARIVAGVAIPLPILGTVGAARAEAAANARVVHRDADAQARELRRRAVMAWIALARSEAELEVRATAAGQAAELEQLTHGRLDAGAGAEVDVMTAAAARARADVAVSVARRAQEAAAAQLAGLLGWDPARPLRSDGPLPGGDPAAAPPVIEALRARLDAHPEHALAAARIDAAEAAAARVATLRRPGLAVEISASFSDPTQPGVDVLGALTLEIPLFSRVGDQLRAARATAAAARARLAATAAELDGELFAAYRRWQAAAETVASFERGVVPAQERATALARQAYREGARDLATALQAERDLAGVRAELAAARAELATAWIELQLAAGEDAGGARAR